MLFVGNKASLCDPGILTRELTKTEIPSSLTRLHGIQTACRDHVDAGLLCLLAELVVQHQAFEVLPPKLASHAVFALSAAPRKGGEGEVIEWALALLRGRCAESRPMSAHEGKCAGNRGTGKKRQ